MHELNQTLATIRRQKKVYLRLLSETPDKKYQMKLKKDINILSEEEKKLLGRLEDLKDVF